MINLKMTFTDDGANPNDIVKHVEFLKTKAKKLMLKSQRQKVQNIVAFAQNTLLSLNQKQNKKDVDTQIHFLKVLECIKMIPPSSCIESLIYLLILISHELGVSVKMYWGPRFNNASRQFHGIQFYYDIFFRKLL